MIAEAIDTALTLGWALLAWIAIGAAITSAVLLASAALIAWTVRAAWRAVTRPSRARSRGQAGRPARDTHEYEEAA